MIAPIPGFRHFPLARHSENTQHFYGAWRLHHLRNPVSTLFPPYIPRSSPDPSHHQQATVASSAVQFRTSRASIAASLRQMKRGFESDLSGLAGAVAIVHQRTLAKTEAADGHILLLQDKADTFEEEAVALKDENEQLRRRATSHQSSSLDATTQNLSYRRNAPRLQVPCLILRLSLFSQLVSPSSFLPQS